MQACEEDRAISRERVAFLENESASLESKYNQALETYRQEYDDQLYALRKSYDVPFAYCECVQDNDPSTMHLIIHDKKSCVCSDAKAHALSFSHI